MPSIVPSHGKVQGSWSWKDVKKKKVDMPFIWNCFPLELSMKLGIIFIVSFYTSLSNLYSSTYKLLHILPDSLLSCSFDLPSVHFFLSNWRNKKCLWLCTPLRSHKAKDGCVWMKWFQPKVHFFWKYLKSCWFDFLWRQNDQMWYFKKFSQF